MVLTAVVGLMLLAGLGLQVHGWAARPGVSRGVHLGLTLPRELGGRPAKDLPLGATEAGEDVVRRVLQCDDVIYRRYSTARGDFEVYAAYWAPNKIPAQLVASHTPDRCWSDNGWTCSAMKFQQDYIAGGHKLQPAEWRIFADPSGTQFVHLLYWHVVGDRPYEYGRSFNWAPNPFHYWTEHARYVMLGSPEQYFVRLTSVSSFEQLWPDPDFQEILQTLSQLVLAQRPQS